MTHPNRQRTDLRVIVVMGVSGAGKTTVGRILARRLGYEFEEGDEYHPASNVAKMRRGVALSDADRAPWLAALATAIDEWIIAGRRVVLSCSALKREYRAQLIRRPDTVRLVYLHGERDLLVARLEARRGHFMPAELLDSQLAALEPPGADERPIIVSVAGTPEQVAEKIETELRL